MKTILTTLARRPTLAAALAGLLAAQQAHAGSGPDDTLSSGLGTLLVYLLRLWS